MDPLVDESIEMAKKLKKLGNSVELSVLAGLPHGFLNFVHVIIVVFVFVLSFFLPHATSRVREAKSIQISLTYSFSISNLFGSQI